MKTNKIMILFFALALLIVACKKENNESLNNKIDETTQKLIDFKKQLQLKSNEQIPVDDANWYLEGLLNYEKANNDHNLPVLEFYKDSIYLNSSNGEIDMAQLSEAYNILTGKLASIQEAKGDPSYKYDVVDLEIKSTNLKDGEVKLTMSSALGNLPIGVSPVPGPTDYWFWGEDNGKCGSYTGQEIGKDAADMLQFWMNQAMLSSGYFTDLTTVEISPYNYPDDDYSGPWESYMLFSASGQNPSPDICLSPTELSYYLNKWNTVIKDDAKPNSSYTFKNVEVVDAIAVPGGWWWFLHIYYANYGIYHTSNHN